MKDRAVDVLRRAILAEGGEWTTARAVKALHGFYQGDSPTAGRARVELNKLVDEGLLARHGKIGRLWTLTQEADRVRGWRQSASRVPDATLTAEGPNPGRGPVMPLMQPTSNYYRITYHSDGTGGEFDFAVVFARADAYSGDGSEFGGYTPGVDVLTAVAEGIAAGIQATNSPSWDNITVVSIEAQPTDVETVVP